jgi:hypothetical protein
MNDKDAATALEIVSEHQLELLVLKRIRVGGGEH